MVMGAHLASLEWCAGFIDGDGCIQVDKSRTKGRKHVGYSLNIQACQISLLPLVALKEALGGSITEHGKASKANNRIWSWWVSGKEAFAAVEKLRPYLLLKRAQADFIVDNPPLYVYTHRGKGSTRLPEANQRWELLYNGLKDLKTQLKSPKGGS